MTNWNEIETILRLTFSILIAALGVILLVTAKDDALASIPGGVFAILGSVGCGYYYAMLTGW